MELLCAPWNAEAQAELVMLRDVRVTYTCKITTTENRPTGREPIVRDTSARHEAA